MAKKDLTTIPGTIAYLFKQHNAEFNACKSWQQMKEVALRLLDDESLTDRQAVITAKKVLYGSYGNKFMSTLCTYMTGEKV